MSRQTIRSVAGIFVSVAVASAVGWAGSTASVEAGGWPVFALCGALSFAINWVAFGPAYAAQTERYYDLTGSLTYLCLVATALTLAGSADPRSLLLAMLVTIWALRLGSFLFGRIRRDGADHRFDRIKPDFARFLMTWTLQGLWVYLTLACALAAMTARVATPLGVFTGIGFVVWLLGFGIEVTADRQKQAFRADPANRDRFITEGLWAWSRHPNYFGEITLWFGVALIALPALTGWQYATLVSPLFVSFLLTRVSGIPMLEARAKRQWGEDPEYQAYVARTPALVLRPPSRS